MKFKIGDEVIIKPRSECKQTLFNYHKFMEDCTNKPFIINEIKNYMDIDYVEYFGWNWPLHWLKRVKRCIII